jgi:hypothetical protein
MEELFGPISATTIAAIVAVLVQAIKEHFQLDGKAALLLSLGVSLISFAPFYLLFYWGTLPTGQLIYSALFYSISGWLLAAGYYSAIKTGFGR